MLTKKKNHLNWDVSMTTIGISMTTVLVLDKGSITSSGQNVVMMAITTNGNCVCFGIRLKKLCNDKRATMTKSEPFCKIGNIYLKLLICDLK